MSGKKIIAGLKDAIAGRVSRVTVFPGRRPIAEAPKDGKPDPIVIGELEADGWETITPTGGGS